MAEEKKLSNEVPSDNIFKELSWWLDFWHAEEVKEWVVKDKIYYMKLYGNIFSIVNIAIFIIFALLFLFVKVQNNPENYSKNFLDPFCFLILSDDMQNTGDYCSSVSSLVVDYDGKIATLKKDIVDKLSLIVKDLYVYESFVDSKEIAFLLDKKTNRLNPLDILNDFDKLKFVINELENSYKLEWLNIKDGGDFSLIEEFANKLNQLSIEQDIYILKDYSDELIKNINAFDIEKVDYLMNTYLNLIENLRGKLENR